MYPDRELIRLAAHKAALRRDIVLRRAQCVEAAARVAQPLELLDRMLALWRRYAALAQIAAVPLGFLITRTVLPRLKILRSVVRWAPLVFVAMRGISAAVKTREPPISSPLRFGRPSDRGRPECKHQHAGPAG